MTKKDVQIDMGSKILTTIYLHSSKESMYSKGRELGLTGAALENFTYCCYEVAVNLEVDKETGGYTILSAEG